MPEPHASQPASSHVLGGGCDARRRLDLLVVVPDAPARRFVEAFAPAPTERALDPAAYPGTAPGSCTGCRDLDGPTLSLDRSPSLVAADDADATAGVAHAVWEAGKAFPVPPPDLVHARLLLAHVPADVPHLRSSAAGVRPGGRVLVDQIDRIDTDVPALPEPLAAMAGPVGSAGGSMRTGRPVHRAATPAGCWLLTDRVVAHDVDPAVAATMFSMNLVADRDHPVIAANAGRRAVKRHRADLGRCAVGERPLRPGRPTIEWSDHQVAVRWPAVWGTVAEPASNGVRSAPER